jgi:hypothetical protein
MSTLKSAAPGFLKPLGRAAVGFNLRHRLKSSPSVSLSVSLSVAVLWSNLLSAIFLD